MIETTLKLIETRIAGKAVRMRFADRDDPKEASEWIEFQVSPEYVVMGHNLFDDPDRLFLAEAHLAALRRARDVIGDEISRLSTLSNQLRR